jgi:hypothetical protein
MRYFDFTCVAVILLLGIPGNVRIAHAVQVAVRAPVCEEAIAPRPPPPVLPAAQTIPLPEPPSSAPLNGWINFIDCSNDISLAEARRSAEGAAAEKILRASTKDKSSDCSFSAVDFNVCDQTKAEYYQWIPAGQLPDGTQALAALKKRAAKGGLFGFR